VSSEVVITGVSGSVGSYLARRLADRGVRVIGVSRGEFRYPGVEHVALDLANPDSPLPNFGSAPLINCAAITRDGWDVELENRIRLMTDSALALTDGPVVHISSSSVYDLTQPSVLVTEDEVVRGHRFLNSYSFAKWKSEEQVAGAGRPAVILRPHAIYGETDTTLLPRLRAAVRGGRLYLPEGGTARHAMTSMENLAGAVDASLAALDSGLAGVTVANVSDVKPKVLAEVIGEALGSRVRIVRVPLWLALRAASGVERQTPNGVEPRLSEYVVRQLAHDRTYNLNVLRQTLGFEPS